jgi:hypothetical protein
MCSTPSPRSLAETLLAAAIPPARKRFFEQPFMPYYRVGFWLNAVGIISAGIVWGYYNSLNGVGDGDGVE